MGSAIFYVDGHNLYHGLRSRFGHRYLWLDLPALAQRVRTADRLVKVRYYTAIVKGEPDAAHRQKTYLAALAAYRPDEVEIIRGHFRGKRFRCRQCNTRWTCGCKPPLEYRTYEEKLTDVALGVAMVRDAAEGVGDTSVLVSTDTDFQPAIEACLEIDPTRRILIAYPPGRHNPHNTFGGRVTAFRIPEENLAAAQLPERFTRAGHTYVRPGKWRAAGSGQRLSEPPAVLAARPASSLATGTRNGEQET